MFADVDDVRTAERRCVILASSKPEQGKWSEAAKRYQADVDLEALLALASADREVNLPKELASIEKDRELRWKGRNDYRKGESEDSVSRWCKPPQGEVADVGASERTAMSI